MKTFTATPTTFSHDWHVVDAAGVPLGRLASVVAQLIRGKHKPTFTPHMDGGDFVVVVNAAKVRLTGRKLTKKKYFPHTGYMGHERFTAARDLLAKHPERVIEKAVFGMLPKNSLARQKLRGKLKVYAGAGASARGAAAEALLRHSVEGERMTADTRVPLAGRRPPQDERRPGVPDAGHRQVGHQRPHAGRLLPPALAGAAHPAVLHRHRYAGRLRREGARGRRRTGRAGRRAAAWRSRGRWWRPMVRTGPSSGPRDC